MRQQLASPAKISKWVVVDFAQADERSLDYFIRELVNAMKNLGML
jgi:eukaryotic translation initiation factor 2C